MNWTRNKVAWVAGPLLALGFYLLPLPLEEPQHKIASIVIFCLVFWLTEALPLSITALCGVTLSVLTGISDIQTAFTSIGHPVIVLFIGSFLLSRSMTRHGLDRRLALHVLSVPYFQKSLFRVFLGFSLVSFLLSMWISNSVTLAMLLPLMVGVIAMIQTSGHEDADVPAYLLLGIAYSASIGGISTMVGSPPNLIGVQYLQQSGVAIDFFSWMLMALPVAVCTYGFLLWYVRGKMKRCFYRQEAVTDYLQRTAGDIQPLNTGERNTIAVFLLAVFLWVLPGVLHVADWQGAYELLNRLVPESVVAMIAAILLFMLPDEEGKGTLRAEDLRMIDWDTILLFGGGIALGTLVTKTGLAATIGKGVASSVSADYASLLVLGLIVSILLLTEVSSNTTIVITFAPIVINILTVLHLEILYPMMGVVIAASFAFMLPVATAPNAMVYGSGLVPMRKMVRTGLWLNVAGAVIIYFWVMMYAKMF